MLGPTILLFRFLDASARLKYHFQPYWCSVSNSSSLSLKGRPRSVCDTGFHFFLQPHFSRPGRLARPPPPFIASYSWYVFFSPPVWRLHQHRNTGSSKDWYVLLQPNAGCILADWEHTFPGVLSLRLTDRHTDRQLDEDFSHLLLLLLLFASSAVVGGLIDWSTSIIFRSVGGKQTDRQTASKAYFPHLLLLLLLLFVSSAVDEGLIDATQLFLLALVDSRHLWRFSPHFCCCSYCLLQVQLSKNWSIDAPRVFW